MHGVTPVVASARQGSERGAQIRAAGLRPEVMAVQRG
jgi:hypothetical protein